MTKRTGILVVGLLLVTATLVALFWPSDAKPGGEVRVNGQVLTVERATNSVEWGQGLSGRSGLAANHGLLFDFGYDSRHSIWMKDMRFAIDVLWLAADGQVEYLVDDMDPASYPMTYQPPEAVRYVLELPNQAIEQLSIEVGTSVSGL